MSENKNKADAVRLSGKDWSDIATSWIGVVSVVVAAFAFYVTYQGSLEDRRTEKIAASLELFNVYVDKLATQREAFYSARRIADASVTDLANQKHGSPKIVDEIYRIRRSSMEKAIYDQDLNDEIDLLIVFYDQVNACSVAGHCDQDIVAALFGGEADVMYEVLAGYISNRKPSQSKFGDGIVKVRLAGLRSGKPADNSTDDSNLVKR